MPKPFAAFDADGTIFKSSLAEKIVEEGISERLFDPEPFNEVYENRRRWQENNSEEVYVDYLQRLVGALVTQMAGVEVERFDAVTTSMIEKQAVRKFRLPKMMIETLRTTHVPIVISGSPDVLVRPFIADLDIDGVYGSMYEIKERRFTGLAKPIGSKAMVLKSLTATDEVGWQGSVAMGDTIGDVSMLGFASRPVMFNASHTLTAYGEKLGWDKAFEAKDRITILRKDPEEEIYHEVSVDDFLGSLAH